MVNREMGRTVRLLILILLVAVVKGREVHNQVKIWPLPETVKYGQKQLIMSNDFMLVTEGSKYKDGSGILKEGFSRFIETVKLGHVIEANVSKFNPSSVLQGLHVVILHENDELQYGVDESYKLLLPSPKKPDFAYLEAQTVYGALQGLQTLSQLFQFNFHTRVIEVFMTPWVITDRPRFSFRGILVDTSRHYQPLSTLKSIIDSMAYAKLNVLHWHIEDTQSFSLEIPSFPKLCDGAYSYSERYTMAEAAELVNYAKRRGVNVLAELNVPGHAGSWWDEWWDVCVMTRINLLILETPYWGIGYPLLWPSKECQQPLDVSNEFTFKVIDGILSDFSKVFKYKFVHLGGDEVDTSCWTTTPRVAKWLRKHNVSEHRAYEYFVLRAQKIAMSHGYEIINWEETFNSFGQKLSKKTVVHNWLGGGVAPKVVEAGLRCIVSNQDKWYLDHLDTTWEQFYMNEPLANITNHVQQKLVLGGEVCMWGETADASDVQQTIWPRAAAAAERLWTPYNKLAKDAGDVVERLSHFRCLLNQRGVPAAPLNGLGRAAPSEPGSCYRQ